MLSPVKILLITVMALAVAGKQCNATWANYLSPHSLGKQDELTDATAILCQQVRVNTTKYIFGSTNFTIYNVTTKCIYNDGKQKADILGRDLIEIYGGFIEFQLWFNYSIARTGNEKQGWAYGTDQTQRSFRHDQPDQLHQGDYPGT